MSSIPSPRFYIYALARPVNKGWKIFYIGKGTKYRVFAHEAEARRGRNTHRHNIIRKVWREGGEIQRYILLTTDDEQEALAYEVEMIALHGRENLCNQTDGGEGTVGHIESESQRARKSLVTRARWSIPSVKDNFSNAMKAHWQDPEYYARVRQKMNEAMQDPAYRDSLSKRSKAMWQNPEYRKRVRQHATPEYLAEVGIKIKERWSDPEYRERRRRETADLWTNPEYRAKTTESIRASRQTPEFKAKMSAAWKARHGTPEAREANRIRLKALWRDPEYRARMLAAQAQARAKKKVQ